MTTSLRADPEHHDKAPLVVLDRTPHGLPQPWIQVAGVVTAVSLLLQHGFFLGERAVGWLNLVDALLAVLILSDLFLTLTRTTPWSRAVSARKLEFAIAGLFLGVLLTSLALPDRNVESLLSFLGLAYASHLTVNLVHLFLLLSICVQALRGIQRLVNVGRPELILAGSFATLVILGGFLLLLPNSSADPARPVTIMEAFFTSTSAVCVTGLVVLDTGSDFSTFGQMVIMILIQMGGLGIITFVAFLAILSSKALPVPQLVVFRQLVNAPRLSDVRRLILGIILATFVIEAAGAAALFRFLPDAQWSLDDLKWCVFHSISAFCNAGFAFQPDSLVGHQSNLGMMFTFMFLIILGGIGFLVILELLGYQFTRSRRLRRIPYFRRLHAGRPAGRISLQAGIALRVTAALLIVGFVGFWILEAGNLLDGRTLKDSFLISAFQSVTPRTAGFNTIPIEELRDVTLVLVMVLMVIGASPMSMGGGIKTVGFGMLLLALRSMITRRERVELSGRCIPVRTLLAALSVFVLYVMFATAGVFLLSLFDPGMSMRDRTFEVISALSTVGLSTGITAQLSTPSQVVLCLLMFVGRVGPIALVLSVFQRGRNLVYDFPEEDVVVG